MQTQEHYLPKDVNPIPCNGTITAHLEKEGAGGPEVQVQKEEGQCFTMHDSVRNAFSVPRDKNLSNFI